MMKKKLMYLFPLLFTIVFSLSGFSQQTNTTKLLIRCDDIGMCHSVNMACKQLIDAKIPFSASMMVVCPWYQEAADILKQHPEVSLGIHLTLNAEWKNYKWGPVAGKGTVPSLTDSCGFFLPSRSSFYANNPKLNEIEIELRAQIERALLTGLKFEYVDYHMGTAVDKPEYRAIVEKLAAEYKLGISRYFGEVDANNVYDDPIGNKADSLAANLSKINPEKINLLVCHIGLDTPEMQAMLDMNSFGLKEMSKHRQAELQALLSQKTNEIVKEKNIKLITYTDLINEIGVKNMKRPADK